jgi:hypothetical protein
MEATTAAPPAQKKSRRVEISPVWLGVCTVGAIVGIVGLFLKAFKLPAGVTYGGTNSMWSAVTGGKVVLVCAVLTLLFLFAAIQMHRRGVLWLAYITALIALLFAALDAGSGFTLTLLDGSTRDLSSSIGPIVSTVGCAIMFISLLIARFTEKRV